jgi:hypothetical protein
LRQFDRQQRLLTVKSLGRIAYSILKCSELVGVLTVDDENKYLRTSQDGSLSLELLSPHGVSAHPTEFFQIEIRASGRKVFDIRWDRRGFFKTLLYEPGEWEQELRDWPEPIPF